MTLMQVYWSAYKPVDFGHEEARNKIPCSKDKTTLVFRELQQRGFIVKVDEAIFSSRKDGLRLARDYGMQLVDKGENKAHHFSWHGLLSPVENILFSDTVLRLIF